MERKNLNMIEFTSHMSKWEAAAVITYIPMHLLVIPTLVTFGMTKGWLNYVDANFLCYAIGAAYMVLVGHAFLRRDFDPMCDTPMYFFLQILSHYGMMLCYNYMVSLVLSLILPEINNQNNNAIMSMAGEDFGKMSAMTIYLAPIVEEVMFRGGIFGTLRNRNRRAGTANRTRHSRSCNPQGRRHRLCRKQGYCCRRGGRSVYL